MDTNEKLKLANYLTKDNCFHRVIIFEKYL